MILILSVALISTQFIIIVSNAATQENDLEEKAFNLWSKLSTHEPFKRWKLGSYDAANGVSLTLTSLTVPSFVNHIDLLHIYMPMIMRGLTLTVPILVNPIDLLHIYMPMLMRELTLTVPSLVNPIDLLHICMPMVMRELTRTVPSLVNPIDFNTTYLHANGIERIKWTVHVVLSTVNSAYMLNSLFSSSNIHLKLKVYSSPFCFIFYCFYSI